MDFPFLRTAALALCLAGVARAGVDQQQPKVDLSGLDVAIGGAGIEQVVAQVVRSGVEGSLTEIRMPIYQVSGPAADLYLYVTEVRGGLPGGRVLGAARLPATRFPSSRTGVFTPMELATPVWLDVGQHFAIVLKARGELGCALSPVGNLYPAGDGWYENTTVPPGWHPLGSRRDLPFQTIIGFRDQVQDVDPLSPTLVIGGSSDQKLAQVVKVGLSGELCGIEIPIVGGSGELLLEIQKVVDGEPSGAVVAAYRFVADELVASSDDFVMLTLSPPLSVRSGMHFAFVLSSGDALYNWVGPAGNPYRRGRAFFDARPNPPGWVDLTGDRDLAFRTRVNVR